MHQLKPNQTTTLYPFHHPPTKPQQYIHPSSALFNKNPEWLLYHELVLTTKVSQSGCCSKRGGKKQRDRPTVAPLNSPKTHANSPNTSLSPKNAAKEYMRSVMSIDPKWLVELAPKFFKQGAWVLWRCLGWLGCLGGGKAAVVAGGQT